MIRLLFLILLGYFTYRLLRLFLPPLRRVDFQKRGDKIEAEEMIACSRCGTFISKSQGVSKDGQPFCSEKCRFIRPVESGEGNNCP
ncbi:MAG: hypothetical protein HYY44_03350 [Deltaproteobacteria bacterium]|nr:hypothetical protein [Deltaproteobacteria bacterium]MBI4374262.1 hypothetical protein [Deltaproteobacteria bacterium]